jgi:O-antigen ligase
VQRTLLFFLVAGSYLLFAGGPAWTLGPLVVLAGLAALAAPRQTFGFPSTLRLLDVSLVALVACILVQVLPLPAAVVAILSPNSARVRSALAFVTTAAPPWTTLSIDRDATLRSVAIVALGILTFWIARGRFGAGGSTRSFCRALAVFAAVVAVLAIVQKAVTPRQILFLLPLEARSGNPFGAFVNRNHFAAWLLLVTAPVCGYLIARLHTHPLSRSRSWRDAVKQFFGSGIVLTAAAAATVTLVLLATLSRSALIGLGAAALCGWRLGRHRMRFERTRLPARLGLVGAAVLITLFFVDVDGWAERLQQGLGVDQEGFGRITIWRETLPMIGDFWLTGTGAGTYSDAMTQYQTTRLWVNSMQRWAHFNNAHSHYLQLASEGGVLLVVPVAVALGLLLRLGRQAVQADNGEMFWVRVGAAAGLAGLAVQGIWEVPLVMPANAVLCGVLAGLMLFDRDSKRADPSTHGSHVDTATGSR